MKKLKSLLIFLALISIFVFAFVPKENLPQSGNSSVIVSQVSLDANNISTFIWNTGIFNQDLRTQNTAGFNLAKRNK